MAFSRDAIAFLHVGHEAADLNHIAREFMADDERRLAAALCPRVPIVDVHVGAAHARASHANENFVLTDPRLRDILELEPGRRGFLYQRFHERPLR